MQERASDHRPPSPAPDLQPLRFAFAQHLPLHRGGKRWEDAARAVIQTSPPPWLPLTRELSPQATEGENSQQAPSAHPASLQARSISPSVKPFGLATSLVRGRQDEGRKRFGQRVSVAAAPALSARKAGFGGECRRPAAGSRFFRRPRRFNPPGSPQRLRCGATLIHHPGRCRSWRSRWSPRPCG